MYTNYLLVIYLFILVKQFKKIQCFEFKTQSLSV